MTVSSLLLLGGPPGTPSTLISGGFYGEGSEPTVSSDIFNLAGDTAPFAGHQIIAENATAARFYWAGPANAASGDTYQIQRSADLASWSTLTAAQAATSPYASRSTTLTGATAFGATSIATADASLFSSSGYAWVDDALVSWTGKSLNTLTGCQWRSGGGVYLAGTTIREAHESYNDAAILSTYNATIYRVRLVGSGGETSPWRYIWVYRPPRPTTADHCVVIVNVLEDAGIAPRDLIGCKAYLRADGFATTMGAHLDPLGAYPTASETNTIGLIFLQLFRSSKRIAVTGATQDYRLEIDTTPVSGQKAIFDIATIPDQEAVVLAALVE